MPKRVRPFTASTAMRQRKYQARKKNPGQVPVWGNDAYITLFYELAKQDGCEVDHIVPLNHPLVSGFHTEHNLQLVTKEYNKYKKDLFWPDMPNYTSRDYEELWNIQKRISTIGTTVR